MNGKLSLGEALSTGLETTIIGLSIVFLVLITLMLVLIAMKYIFAPKKDKKAKAVVPKQEPVEVFEQVAEEDEEELIAILTAAVAASLNTSTYNLKIKSFRRIGTSSTTWQRAGLNETIDNRY